MNNDYTKNVIDLVEYLNKSGSKDDSTIAKTLQMILVAQNLDNKKVKEYITEAEKEINDEQV